MKTTDEKKMWTQHDIVDWHVKTFPNATLGSQLVKFNEELNELEASTEDKAKELADMFIVAIVLMLRFNCKIGYIVLNALLPSLLGSLHTPQENEQYLNNLISDKMNINASRTWGELEPGLYKHKEDEDVKQ